MSFDNTLHSNVKRLAEVLRENLAVEETVSGFTFDLKIRGRVNGELEITYRLNDEYDTYNTFVEGDCLSAVLEEYLRRHGWKREHKPLCLPAA